VLRPADEIERADAEESGEALHGSESEVSLASLDGTYVGPV
jgi:hypothetical protein